MLYQNCVQLKDQTIFGLRVFGAKFSILKHIVVSALFNLKDYPFYTFHPIWIKLRIYDQWANALRKSVQIRNSTPGGHGRGS